MWGSVCTHEGLGHCQLSHPGYAYTATHNGSAPIYGDKAGHGARAYAPLADGELSRILRLHRAGTFYLDLDTFDLFTKGVA